MRFVFTRPGWLPQPHLLGFPPPPPSPGACLPAGRRTWLLLAEQKEPAWGPEALLNTFVRRVGASMATTEGICSWGCCAAGSSHLPKAPSAFGLEELLSHSVPGGAGGDSAYLLPAFCPSSPLQPGRALLAPCGCLAELWSGLLARSEPGACELSQPGSPPAGQSCPLSYTRKH